MAAFKTALIYEFRGKIPVDSVLLRAYPALPDRALHDVVGGIKSRQGFDIWQGRLTRHPPDPWQEPFQDRSRTAIRSSVFGKVYSLGPVAHHSTVTDFAKFRGWSTSVPLMTAVW